MWYSYCAYFYCGSERLPALATTAANQAVLPAWRQPRNSRRSFGGASCAPMRGTGRSPLRSTFRVSTQDPGGALRALAPLGAGPAIQLPHWLALSRLRQVPWAAKLEENTALIREEYDALVASKAPSDYHLHTDEHKVQTAARGSCFCSCTHFALRPAHSCTPGRGTGTRTSRLGSGSRSLSGAGAARSRFRHLPPRRRCVSPHRHCPTTASLLNNIPGLMTDIPFAYSFFSTLAPGSAIAPHHGATNLKVRCHLTLHCAFPQRRMPRRCNPAHCTALPHCLLSSPTRLPAVCLARGR